MTQQNSHEYNTNSIIAEFKNINSSGSTGDFEELYPKVVQVVLKYVINRKLLNHQESLVDLISDFCTKKQVPVELVGDAIQSDPYFKSCIQSDINWRAQSVSDW